MMIKIGVYIRGKCKEKDIYYVFIDEIQKVEEGTPEYIVMLE